MTQQEGIAADWMVPVRRAPCIRGYSAGWYCLQSKSGVEALSSGQAWVARGLHATVSMKSHMCMQMSLPKQEPIAHLFYSPVV